MKLEGARDERPVFFGDLIEEFFTPYIDEDNNILKYTHTPLEYIELIPQN